MATTLPPAPPAMRSKLGGAVVGTLTRLRAAYRLGGRAMPAAWPLVALAVLPELLQHVVEIRLGMFASLESFRAHADDTLRWSFGYAKVAGFMLAIFAIARFWAKDGSMRGVFRMPRWAIGRLSLSIVLGIVLSLPFKALEGRGVAVGAVATLVSLAIQIVLSVYMVGALVEDRSASLRWSATAGWPRALFMALLLAAVFAPCQALHMADHRLAIGAPTAVVWALMLWDAVFLGLFAALLGAATFVGYCYGPDWRGWDRPLDSAAPHPA